MYVKFYVYQSSDYRLHQTKDPKSPVGYRLRARIICFKDLEINAYTFANEYSYTHKNCLWQSIKPGIISTPNLGNYCRYYFRL